MGRSAQRRQANSANRRINAAAWFYRQSFTSAHRDPAPRVLTCGACGREVFTLVEGECLTCHAPAEGKNLRQMTAKQCEEQHACGLTNRRHVDGWDGNWLDCEEAWRRAGGRRETFAEMDARIADEMRREEDQ